MAARGPVTEARTEHPSTIRSSPVARSTTAGERLTAVISRIGNWNADALLRDRLAGAPECSVEAGCGEAPAAESTCNGDLAAVLGGRTPPIGDVADPAERDAEQFAQRTAAAPLLDCAPAAVSGSPLPQQLRSGFEATSGTDLGGVRVHHDAAAAAAAARLGAAAFAVGSHVVFGAGRYQPEIPAGLKLLAHEIGHVVSGTSNLASGQPVRRMPDDDIHADESGCSAESSATSLTCPAVEPVCEPIPDNPLAAYPFLAVALDRDSLQLLQDAAYRREHLRRAIPYNGPQGLFFAQGHLKDFLAPGTEYVSREELVSALLPGLLDAARNHGDAEPYIAEIARNEAARQMLEPIRDQMLNVELPDPDGLDGTPTRLTFAADFKQLPDDHGALALSSLDPLSNRSAYAWTIFALDDARQLADIAGLNAKTEWLLKTYDGRLEDMFADPADYTLDEVYALWHDVMPGLVKQADVLSSVLKPGNLDQADLVATITARVQSLSARAGKAMDAMNTFRSNNKVDRTDGEIYEDNADAIRKNASEDWDEGGWHYFGWFFNKIGLGANKLLHASGNAASGFYMDTHAARAHAYRVGHISYNDYSGIHPADIVKGAIGDLAIALPFFGKAGAGASALLGLGEETVGAGYVEGTAAGVYSGASAAVATDTASWAASNLSLSESERRFQAAQIGGPLSWIEAGAWSGVIGGPAGALAKLMPKPVNAPRGPAVEGDATPSQENQPGDSELVSRVDEPESPLTSTESGDGNAGMSKPASGLKGYLQRSLLNKFVASALEGSEPLHFMPTNAGSVGDLTCVVGESAPLTSTAPADVVTGPMEFDNMPDPPASSVAPVEPGVGSPVELNVEVTEAADPSVTSEVSGQPALPDFGGVSPAPGTRTTSQAQWRADYRADRIERRIDAIFAQLERGAGQQAPQADLQPVMALNIQAAIQQALQNLRDNLRASGRRPAGNAAFGTMLHAELARVLRAQGFPPGAIPRVELTLQAFGTLPPDVLQRTVDQWFQNEGQAYQWLRSSIPQSVLNSRVADIRPDFEISVGGNNIVFDLTSRERESHLAKTMLYAALLAREGQRTRVQEYYWVRWNWRGR